MLTALFRRVGKIAIYGTLVFAFVLVAHVNLDDLRLKLGELLQPNDTTIRVGGLYVVTPAGHVQPGPPVCMPDDQLLAAHFRTETNDVKLRNNLGYYMPLVSQISNYLIPGGGQESVTVVNVAGHTLVVDDIANTQLLEEAGIGEYLGMLYQTSQSCEKIVRRHWDDGDCVALVHRLTKSGESVLGYTINRGCLIPAVESGSYDKRRLKVPQPRRGLTAMLSQFKDFVGLITYETPVAVQAANASHS